MTTRAPAPDDLPRYQEGYGAEQVRAGSSHPAAEAAPQPRSYETYRINPPWTGDEPPPAETALEMGYAALRTNVTEKFPAGTNPMKGIRRKCIDCSGGLAAEVDRCPAYACPLWPFRMGKNPFRKAKPAPQAQGDHGDDDEREV